MMGYPLAFFSILLVFARSHANPLDMRGPENKTFVVEPDSVAKPKAPERELTAAEKRQRILKWIGKGEFAVGCYVMLLGIGANVIAPTTCEKSDGIITFNECHTDHTAWKEKKETGNILFWAGAALASSGLITLAFR
jgi:hypothetical protein